jgi:hypothetical protein
LSPGYDYLDITATGGVGGTGVHALSSQFINNLGVIDTRAGSHYGIVLSTYAGGGGVYNGTSGLIEGVGGIRAYGAVSVRNLGTILANGFTNAVEIFGSGTIVNGDYNHTHALMAGNGVGMIGGAMETVHNYATIQAYVYLGSGGQVTNGGGGDTTALIGGDVRVGGRTGTINNFASIHSVLLAGAYLTAGGVVTNGSAGDTRATIDGGSGVAIVNGAGTVTNFGELDGEFAYLDNSLGYGVLINYGGVLTNGSTLDRTALVQGYTGASIAKGGTVANFGTILGGGLTGAASGVYLRDGGVVTNGGGVDRVETIEGASGVLVHAGTATVKNFGTILAGGSGAAGVDLRGGGAVSNGSVNNHQAVIEGYTGVAVTGSATVTNLGTILGLGDAGGFGVDLKGAETLVNGAAGHGARATIYGYQGVRAEGAGATVTNFGTIGGAAGTAVAFGSATDVLVVEAGSSFDGAVLGGGGTLVLDSGAGTLSNLFSGGNVTVSGSMATTTFSNFGALQIAAAAQFTLAGTGSIGGGQSLADAGALSIGATLTSAGSLSVSGTLAGAGRLVLAGGTAALNAGASLTIAQVTVAGAAVKVGTNLAYAGQWTQSAGSVTVAAGDVLTFTGAGDSLAGTLGGAGKVALVGGSDTLSATTLTAAGVSITGSVVTLSGAINNGSVITVASPSLTVAAAGVTLSGGGSLTLTDTNTNQITGATGAATLTNVNNIISGAGAIGGGLMTLVNQSAGVINASGTNGLIIDTGANTIVNAGQIMASGAGGLTVQSAINNTGTIAALNGNVTVNGAVTGAGVATVTGATLDFASTFTENVTFGGATGILELGRSQGYTGTITGFSKTGGTSLDLADIGFVGAGEASFSGTKSGGVLTVTDGTHTAHINLKGDYRTSVFVAASDGHGGTIIHDPAAGAIVPPTTAGGSAAAFSAAMAALPGGGAAACGQVAVGGMATREVLVATPRAY